MRIMSIHFHFRSTKISEAFFAMCVRKTVELLTTGIISDSVKNSKSAFYAGGEYIFALRIALPECIFSIIHSG